MFERETRIVPEKRWSLCAAPLALALVACGASVAPLGDGGTDRGNVGPDASTLDVIVPDVTTPPPFDAGNACIRSMVADVVAPSVLFAGQPLGVSVSAPGQGCGCALTLQPNALSSARGFDPVLCNCCRECECVDGSYSASALLGAPGVGSTQIAVTGSPRRTVFVIESPEQCDGSFVRVREVTVLAPEGRVTGPALHWAIISGTHRYCCDAGVGFVENRQGNAFTLGPRSCETLGCAMACPAIADREDRPFTSAHMLGVLTTGDYRLTVGATTLAFTVRR